ncbi:MAG: response regulator [Candidatus Binatota bacterium]
METKKTILVVDDDRDVVTIVRGILNGGEYDVQCVHSGQEVFTRLGKERPDLIILDIKMPEMDGFEVLKRLKAIPETSSIPVILLTGRGQYRDVLEGYQLGTDYYMNKPFTSAQLINGVHLFLGDGNAQQAVSGAIR